MNSLRTVAVLAVLLLAGCNKPSPSKPLAPPTQPPQVTAAHATDSRPAGIAWFDGSVEEAFATARTTNKPVLLYWGAQWCPPCHLLKATVFADAGFQAKSGLFVPVYLDGDLEGAQRWGEHFRITGYPTLLALNADQSEIRRIAGGMELDRYATLLDEVLDNRQSVAEVLKSLNSASGTADAAACRRVAWNAWGLDDGLDAGDSALAQALLAAAHRCGTIDPALGLRLNVFAAAASPKIAAKNAADIEKLLGEPELVAGQIDALMYLGTDYFENVSKVDAARAQRLAGLYGLAMEKVQADPKRSRVDQLDAVYSALVVQKAMSPAKFEPMARAVRARVEQEQQSLPKDPYLRSGVVTDLLAILDKLGDFEPAYAMARREVDASPYGYYFMTDLADICESLHRNDEALQWYERAYRESKGPATRFQWGSRYLQALLRLSPDDLPRIKSAGTSVLAELGAPDAVYRRSRIRLEGLDKKLREWRDASPALRAPVAAELSREFAGVCKEKCGGFLAS